MVLKTRHFGTIEVDEKDFIDFPEGVPGFENVKKFVLLGKIEEDSPFQWIQGIDNPELAFAVIDPRLFKPDYAFDVDDRDVEMLDIKDVNTILVFSIVVVPEDMKKISANLKAPVLINASNNKGKQVVLANSEYQIRHYILDELQKIGG